MIEEARMMDPATLLLVLMMSAVPAPTLGASGSPSTPRIDHRQAVQQQRIDEGVASGELTGKETARLQAEQARIRRVEDGALADGRLTRKERARIEHMQDEANTHISRQTHDRQRTN
jgi:hypothetical protein